MGGRIKSPNLQLQHVSVASISAATMMESHNSRDYMEALIRHGQGRKPPFLEQYRLLTKRCQHRDAFRAGFVWSRCEMQVRGVSPAQITLQDAVLLCLI